MSGWPPMIGFYRGNGRREPGVRGKAVEPIAKVLPRYSGEIRPLAGAILFFSTFWTPAFAGVMKYVGFAIGSNFRKLLNVVMPDLIRQSEYNDVDSSRLWRDFAGMTEKRYVNKFDIPKAQNSPPSGSDQARYGVPVRHYVLE